MEIIVLMEGFEELCLIEDVEVLWSTRYNTVGEFEIVKRNASDTDVSIFQTASYVKRLDNDYVGVIENICMEQTIEDGTTLTVSGRMLESILDRRIVREQTTLSGNVEDCIYKLLDENVINPSLKIRKIDNFACESKKRIAKYTNIQVTGKTILEIIMTICQECRTGFKIHLQGRRMMFELYEGKNKSIPTSKDGMIIFSQEFGNLLSSKYVKDRSNEKNFALVAGEGEGKDRKTAMIGINTGSGLNLKEMFVDARDLSSNNGELTDSQYSEKLRARGTEKISACTMTTAFQGDVDVTSYAFHKEFDLGDIVLVQNEKWGVDMKPRIVEVLETFDATGYTINATFGE